MEGAYTVSFNHHSVYQYVPVLCMGIHVKIEIQYRDVVVSLGWVAGIRSQEAR